MTDILEVPVDPPEGNLEETAEIENNTDIHKENINIPEPKTPAVKKKTNVVIPEPEVAPKKGRGRPAGAKNRPKPKARLPEPEPELVPEPVRRPPQVEYYSPPVDPTAQLLGLLKSQMDQRQAMKRQKYAGWVGRF